jgi:hypothetical protein
MDKKPSKTGRNRNKLTTNTQVTDMALTLWECSEYITKTMLRTNMNSYFRDRIVRITQRLGREAIGLGYDLSPPNKTAFESANSAKSEAKQLGLTN